MTPKPPADVTWMCGAFQPRRPGYRCTEPYGHGGDLHRAKVDGETVAVWPRQERTGTPQ